MPEQHRPLPPLDVELVFGTFRGWFKAREARTKNLGPPPWVVVKRFEDPNDDDVMAAVYALHIAGDEPWHVRGVLRAVEQGPLVLTRISVEHLTDPSVEVPSGMRLPVATIRDNAHRYLRDAKSPEVLELFATTLGRHVTAAEKEWANRVASENAKKPLTRGRRGYPPDHFRRIALRAVELFDSERRNVVGELAAEEGRPYQTVRDWIGRARKLGFLAPVTQGRRDFHPGPNLYSKEGRDDA